MTMKMMLRAMREQKVEVESAKRGDKYRFIETPFLNSKTFYNPLLLLPELTYLPLMWLLKMLT